MTRAAQPQERIKVWRPQGFEGVELEFFENLPDLVVEPFVMQGYELTVALQGEAKVRYAGQNYRWENFKDIFLAQHPDEIFAGDGGSGQPTSVWTLRLFPEGMSSLLHDLGQADRPLYFPEMTAPDALNGPLAALLKETMCSFDVPSSHIERESRLLGLAYAVLKHCSDTPPSDLKLGKEHKAVRLVKEVAQAHYAQELKLDYLAQLAGLSKFYLTRVFQRDMGISPHEYQMGVRIHHAKGKLARGEKPAEVAFDLGFSDQAHLTRTFKKYTQTTPGRFQRFSLAD